MLNKIKSITFTLAIVAPIAFSLCACNANSQKSDLAAFTSPSQTGELPSGQVQHHDIGEIRQALARCVLIYLQPLHQGSLDLNFSGDVSYDAESIAQIQGEPRWILSISQFGNFPVHLTALIRGEEQAHDWKIQWFDYAQSGYSQDVSFTESEPLLCSAPWPSN